MAPPGLPAYTLPPTGPQNGPMARTSIETQAGRRTGPPARPSIGTPPSTDGQSAGSAAPNEAGPETGAPPAGGAPTGRPVPAAATAPYGVTGPDGSRQPFGGPTAPVSTPPAGHPYGPGTAVPHQRGEGTLYGGAPADTSMPVPLSIDMTMPISTNPVETSGSLTGHILSQGWDQGPDEGRRSNVTVGIAMLLVLLAMIGVSLLFLATTGSAFSGWLHGLTGR